jgi:pilus assembly protein CpaB
LAKAGSNGVGMNRRLITIFLVAIVIASAACWLVYRIVNVKLSAAKPLSTTQVIAASKDIPLGAVLTTADLTTMTLTGTPPKGAIVKQEDAVGRGVITNISQGEPILDSQLASLGSGGGLAPTIPQGMRACAVRVDEVVGVAGFVTPGMRVDVLASGNPPGEGQNEGVVTETILQNIQVLSAGTDIQRDQEGKPLQVQVVNLLVTPEQAELLSLAANSLKIQLVLRNPLDTQMTKVPTTSMSNLFGSQTPAPKEHVAKAAPKPAAKPYQITVMNGNKTSDEKFATPEGQH